MPRIPVNVANNRRVERLRFRRDQIRIIHWWAQLNRAEPRPYPWTLWNRQCDNCRALLLNYETSLFCCNNGNHILPRLPPYPELISDLIRNTEIFYWVKKMVL